MQDPLTENIDGTKVEEVTHEFSHNVEHHVPWGQILLGVGLLAVAYVGYKAFLADSSSGTDESDESDEFDELDGFGGAAEIPVSGGGLTA